MAKGEKGNVVRYFPAFALIVIVICALVVVFFAARAVKVEMPHSGENATLMITGRLQEGPSFFESAENLDKWGRTIKYQHQGYYSSGGGASETLIYYLDEIVGYEYSKTEGGNGWKKQYACFFGNCTPPFTMQTYAGSRFTKGIETLTTCYQEGMYELTEHKVGTEEFTTSFGKGCPIEG